MRVKPDGFDINTVLITGGRIDGEHEFGPGRDLYGAMASLGIDATGKELGGQLARYTSDMGTALAGLRHIVGGFDEYTGDRLWAAALNVPGLEHRAKVEAGVL